MFQAPIPAGFARQVEPHYGCSSRPGGVGWDGGVPEFPVASLVSNSLGPYGPQPACQAPLSTGSSRQEYWSGLPCPPPGELPDPGSEPASLASPTLAGRFFTISTTWDALTGGGATTAPLGSSWGGPLETGGWIPAPEIERYMGQGQESLCRACS